MNLFLNVMFAFGKGNNSQKLWSDLGRDIMLEPAVADSCYCLPGLGRVQQWCCSSTAGERTGGGPKQAAAMGRLVDQGLAFRPVSKALKYLDQNIWYPKLQACIWRSKPIQTGTFFDEKTAQPSVLSILPS